MRVVAALVAVGVLLASGDGALAPPRSLGDFAAWIEDRGAVTAALALLRLAALVVAGGLAAVVALAVLARAVGAVHVASVLARLLPFGVAVSLASPAGGVPAQQDGTATMSVLPDDEAQPTTTTVAVPSPAPAPTTPQVDEWVVAPGESFWSIAEDVLADALGREPSDGEIVPYWRGLIEANRDRLLSPNPDLIRPGQVFLVPPA